MDELELQLTKIWESVLGRSGIGVRDSFWDLGGHSLIAIRMMRRIESVMGKELPIATLLHVPTIEELAKLLRQSGRQPACSSLVAIQPSGTNPPIFFVHGIGGQIIGFRGLASHLGPEQPFYGLQAQGMYGGQPILTRVEDMASDYLREIRMLKPHGPYYLGGLSFGGLVAYEMAQQLSAQGEDVGMVALCGTFAENWARKQLIMKLMRLPINRSLSYAVHKTGVYAKNLRHMVAFQFLPQPLKEIRKSLHHAAAAYTAQPYSGRVVYFWPEKRSIRDFDDARAGWGELAANLEIVDVPGDHDTILDEPNVGFLAGQLKGWLRRCQQHSPGASLVGPGNG